MEAHNAFQHLATQRPQLAHSGFQQDSVLKTVHTDFLRPLTSTLEGTRTLAHGLFILEGTAETLLHSNYTLSGGSQSLTGDEVTVPKSLRLP